MAAAEGADDEDGGKSEGGEPENAEKKQEEDHMDGGWEDEEERARLLAQCQPGTQDEERLPALAALHEKAMESSNWEPLWADKDVRAALLSCADPPDPDFGKNPFGEEEPDPPSDFVRTLAVTTLVCLATCVGNRSAMAEHPLLRHALVGNADEDRAFRLRERVFLLLCGLLLAGACTDPSDDHVPSRPPTPMKCEVCGLIPCVCKAGEKVWRNSDLEVCHALMLGVAPELPVGLRVGVLGTLCTVALSSVVDPALLWGNRKLRAGLVNAALPGEPEDVRVGALEALWAFTACDLVQPRMWGEKPVREALLRGAEAYAKVGEGEGETTLRQTEGVRSRALNSLANLASSVVNRAPMWKSSRLATAVLQAVSGGGPLRSDSLRVLAELTKQWTNRAKMVAAGVLELLEAAEDDEALSFKERRNCGFARERLQEARDAALSGPFQP
mmetsp:Transcript_6601/g.16694  ORF Transcript_6601/g.16694 Transcript_6601/m.16694 type:complete len:444 (-) Transcript_6601:73-1404(-)